MGSLNYKNNELFNLGLNTNNFYEFENEENEILIENYYYEIETILNNYKFNYYNIEIKSGYYDGLYLEIDSNEELYFRDFLEKKEVQKEITELKKCFIELVNLGLIFYKANWCSTFFDKKETISILKQFIKNEREKNKKIPTEKNYYRGVKK